MKENLTAFNSLGIDTIRCIVPLKIFHKWLLKNNYIQLSSNIILNKQIELVEYDKSIKNKLSKKENTQKILYKIKNTNNRNSINSFMVAEHTIETISKSKEAKKNPNYYIEISLNGLHQPHKEISSHTYHLINKLIKKYKIHSIDLACDNTFNKYNLLSLKESLKPYGSIKTFETSIYINNPKLNNNISKLIIYNKAKKHNIIDKNWMRIEATILLNTKIKNISDLDINKEIDFLYLMNDNISKKQHNLNKKKLDTQIKIVSDLRSLSKNNNKYKDILKLSLSQNTQAKHHNKVATNKAYIKANKNNNTNPIKDTLTTHNIKPLLVYRVYTIQKLNNWQSKQQKSNTSHKGLANHKELLKTMCEIGTDPTIKDEKKYNLKDMQGYLKEHHKLIISIQAISSFIIDNDLRPKQKN